MNESKTKNEHGRAGLRVRGEGRSVEAVLASALHSAAPAAREDGEDVDALLALCEERGVTLAELSADDLAAMLDEVRVATP